jgi:hypothetical protein
MTEGCVPRNDKEVVPLRPFLLSLRAEGVAIPGKLKRKNQRAK